MSNTNLQSSPSGGPAAPLRVIVFSSIAPIEPFRLVNRLDRDLPGAEVAGLVYERRPAKTLGKRMRGWMKRMKEPGYLGYVLRRSAGAFGKKVKRVGGAMLKFAQASPVVYHSAEAMSLEQLAEKCQRRGWPLLITEDIHGQESLEFVRQQKPDLGIVLGTRILKPALYEIPKQGSINIHKRKVPDYRGGGPIGLWEMLDGQSEIGVTVHRVAEKVDTGAVVRSAVIRIHPYDTLLSLTLKADLIGEELLLAAVRDMAEGTVTEKPQTGAGKTFKTPKPHELVKHLKKLAAMRLVYRVPRTRPAWKLLLRSSLYLWALPVRNWVRRIRKRFPVVILYHHLLSDRPRPMAQPTEQFLQHLRYLKRHYRLVSLREAMELLASGKVDQPTAVLTFDDGYQENFLCLRAALRAEPAPVTMFVCPKLIEQGAPFPHDLRDQRLDFPPLTPAELKSMDVEGIEIGSHTRTHFDCGSTDVERLTDEIAGSRKDLERILGHPVPFFAFPWGTWAHMSEEAMEIAAGHYDVYFSAFGGVNLPGATPHCKRQSYPFSLWETELALQNILGFEPRAPQRHGRKPAELPAIGRQLMAAPEQTQPEGKNR